MPTFASLPILLFIFLFVSLLFKDETSLSHVVLGGIVRIVAPPGPGCRKKICWRGAGVMKPGGNARRNEPIRGDTVLRARATFSAGSVCGRHRGCRRARPDFTVIIRTRFNLAVRRRISQPAGATSPRTRASRTTVPEEPNYVPKGK